MWLESNFYNKISGFVGFWQRVLGIVWLMSNKIIIKVLNVTPSKHRLNSVNCNCNLPSLVGNFEAWTFPHSTIAHSIRFLLCVVGTKQFTLFGIKALGFSDSLVTLIKIFPKEEKQKEEKVSYPNQGVVDLLPLLHGEISTSAYSILAFNQ